MRESLEMFGSGLFVLSSLFYRCIAITLLCLCTTVTQAADVTLLNKSPSAAELARQLVVRCSQARATSKNDCHQVALQETVRQHGAALALDEVVELTRLDLAIAVNTHMYVHWIGWESFAFYGNPTQAFMNCKDTFGSGCYHGVLQKYLEKVGNVTENDVREVCYTVIDTGTSAFLKYQCLHGVGHGLMLHFNRDVELSLKMCDALTTDWDRESCYGGVFMENYGATHKGHDHSHGDALAAHRDTPRVSGLHADDLHYPCSAVDEKYKRTCYFLQTSAVFSLVGQDYLKVFRTCDSAPKQHIEMCYRSLGRDISGYTVNNAQKVQELCLLGTEPYVAYCYVGAVQDFVNNTARPDTGLKMCAILDNQYRRDCYAAVGEMLLALIPDEKKRTEACEKAEKHFVPACKAGARLF